MPNFPPATARRRVLALLPVLVALAACGSDDAGTTTPTPTPTPGRYEVVTIGLTFSPTTLTVPRGATVNFVFAPSPAHNAIFAKVTGAPADILVTQNQTVQRTFATTGTFRFDCTLHPGMKGEVVVTP